MVKKGPPITKGHVTRDTATVRNDSQPTTSTPKREDSGAKQPKNGTPSKSKK